MKVTIYKIDGTSSGREAELSDDVFNVEPNETLIYEDVRRILGSRRQGTAKTKERSEVRGSGKKAYRQKGTGMARRGSVRSPLLKGGGTVFGPSPRSYTVRLTRKMRQLARKSALSLKARGEAITVVEDFTFDEPKTREFSRLLTSLELAGKKVLLLTAATDPVVYKSARNIPGVDVVEANNPTTVQILHADVLLVQEGGLQVLEESLNPGAEEEAA